MKERAVIDKSVELTLKAITKCVVIWHHGAQHDAS